MKWFQDRKQAFYATFAPLVQGTEQTRFIGDVYKSGDLATYLQAMFNLAIVAGGILAVIRLTYAGYLYMLSDTIGDKGTAKKIIWETLTGLLLLLGIVIILNQINPDLLKFNLNLQPVNTTSGGASATENNGF